MTQGGEQPDWHNAETCIDNMQIAYDDALEADPFDDGNPVPTDTVVDAGDLGVLIGLARYAARHRPASAPSDSGMVSVPPGWKLVPVKPIDAMVMAGSVAIEQTEVGDDHSGFATSWHPCTEASWSAMLTAAPAPEHQEPRNG